jgi:hypothetical protein
MYLFNITTGDRSEYTSILLEFLTGKWFKKYNDLNEHNHESK